MNLVDPRVIFGACALIGSLALGTGAALATTISFNDTSDEMMTVAIDGKVTNTIDETKTNVLSVTQTLALAAAATVDNFFTLTDPANADDPVGTLSDFLKLSTVKGAKTYSITFTSDFAALSAPPRKPFGTADETGDFQVIKDSPGLGEFAFPTDQPHPAGLVIEMASDVAVPEPSTLALIGVGLLGMSVARRRRERRKAHHNRAASAG